jgi:hypothetical protein
LFERPFENRHKVSKEIQLASSSSATDLKGRRRRRRQIKRKKDIISRSITRRFVGMSIRIANNHCHQTAGKRESIRAIQSETINVGDAVKTNRNASVEVGRTLAMLLARERERERGEREREKINQYFLKQSTFEQIQLDKRNSSRQEKSELRL